MIIGHGKPYRIITDFLSTPERNGILAWVRDHEAQFTNAGVIGDQSWRKAKILFSFPPFDELIRTRIRQLAPRAAQWFGITDLDPPGYIETQLTISAHEHYFHRHIDSGSPETADRRISYVFYLHTEPRQWDGGDLEVEGHILPVINNSLVLFHSASWHELRKVTMRRPETARLFEGRISLNGWARHNGATQIVQPSVAY